MRVLVTGATGFLGRYVVDALSKRGHEVRALVRPDRRKDPIELSGVEVALGHVLDEASLVRATRDVEGLVHCAAMSGYWSRRNLEQRLVNVEGTAALYRAAHRNQLQRIVHVSTVAVVGPTRDGRVLDETAPWCGDVVGMNYIVTKREGEERALAAAWGKMPVVVVNPSALMGPRKDGRPISWHLQRIAAGRFTWAPQGGTSVVDVEDVAEGAVSALERGRVGERYILAGHNIRWTELFEAIGRAVGIAPRIREIPKFVARALVLGSTMLDNIHLSRPPWTPELFRSWGWYAWFDSTKARTELGYRFRPFDETLRRYDWSSR